MQDDLKMPLNYNTRQIEDLRNEMKQKLANVASTKEMDQLFQELELKVDRAEFEEALDQKVCNLLVLDCLV